MVQNSKIQQEFIKIEQNSVQKKARPTTLGIPAFTMFLLSFRPVAGPQVWQLPVWRLSKDHAQQGKSKPISSKASQRRYPARQAVDVPWMSSRGCKFSSCVVCAIYMRRVVRFAVPLLACRLPPVVCFDLHQYHHRRVLREEASGLRLMKLLCKEA